MLHVKKPTREETSDFSTHSVTLTPIEMDALQQVSQDITDEIEKSETLGVSEQELGSALG